MGFLSVMYFLFLYSVLFLVARLRAWRSILLGAGAAFYLVQDRAHAPLLLFIAVVGYRGGLALSGEKKSRWRLVGLLLAVFSPLVFFKWKMANGSLVFPLGISFFSFHAASYLIDVYRGTIQPEKSWQNLFLYITYFPQLIAGPIARAAEVLPQFRIPGSLCARNIQRGLWRVYLGLFKKLAIANYLAIVFPLVFAKPGEFGALVVLAAIVSARYFIFADFSGYSDIAIGSSRLLGVELPENFHRPFAASSPAEFWRRWHITLSTWIRDYLFFPLAASPAAILGTYPIIIFSFIVLGAWHGFNMNFLLYGVCHGVILVLADLTRKPRKAFWDWCEYDERILASWIFPWGTFLLFVCPPTVFFFTQGPSEAMAVLRALGRGRLLAGVEVFYRPGFLVCLASLALLESYYWTAERYNLLVKFERLPLLVRLIGVALGVAWLVKATQGAVGSEFIYSHF